jgi:cytochrome P450
MGFTVLTRYEDVARALRGAEFARDIEAHVPVPADPARQKRRERFQKRIEEGRTSKSILNLDPPDHTRLRRLVTQAFTPSAIERLRPRIQQLVDDVLDVAAERGSMELVDELAFPMPFQVISDLLALPTDRSDEVRDWSQALTASLEPTADEATLDASEAAAEQMSEYLREVIAHRRQHLGDDLLSALLQVARTVTRRAERSSWIAVKAYPDSVSQLPARYLNRLSDLLFILCRVANPGGDVLWQPGGADADSPQKKSPEK